MREMTRVGRVLKQLVTPLMICGVLLAIAVAPTAKAAPGDEFGTIFIYYGGNAKIDPAKPRPADMFVSNQSFVGGSKEYITGVTVSGYGQSARRVWVKLYGLNGVRGGAQVQITKAQANKAGVCPPINMLQQNQWYACSLEFNKENFALKNRKYEKPSLFWISEIRTNKGTYRLNPPSLDDDIEKP
jgi:hypothetical protein